MPPRAIHNALSTNNASYYIALRRLCSKHPPPKSDSISDRGQRSTRGTIPPFCTLQSIVRESGRFQRPLAVPGEGNRTRDEKLAFYVDRIVESGVGWWKGGNFNDLGWKLVMILMAYRLWAEWSPWSGGISNALLRGLFRLNYLYRLVRIATALTIINAPIVLPDTRY